MKSLYQAGLGLMSILVITASIQARAQSRMALLPPSVTSKSVPGCPANPEIIPPALRDTRVVAFGEFHGTQEIPRLVGDHICALAMQDRTRPVVYAWEFDSDEQALFDAYMNSPGQPADVARLLAGPQWQADKQDGRASRAGLGLIERLRQLKAAGYPVSVVLFMEGRNATPPDLPASADEWEDSRRHEQRMTALLLKGLAAHPGARVVIEAGNLHVATRGDAFTPPRPSHPPMGMLLRQAGVDIVSLNNVFGGTSNHHWACDLPDGVADRGGTVTPDMVVCKDYPGPEATIYHPTPTIRLDAFDGTYYVASTSASPPAIETKP